MAPDHPTLCKGPSALASPTPKDDPGCARRLAFGRDGLAPACRLKLTLLKGHGGRRSPGHLPMGGSCHDIPSRVCQRLR
jgi:hypothetical protein